MSTVSSDDKKLIHDEVRDGVAWVTLTNPPANAYSHAMMLELDAAILRARFDERVHVIVLVGEGDKFFCAGADIKWLGEITASYKYNFCLHANETLLRLEQTPKLVIAALNGHCVGGGLEIALAADLRIARLGAGKLGLPEVNLGVLPGTGGTQRLSRAVGKSKAIEMMVTGESLSFADARALGLVNKLVEGDGAEFRSQVQAWAKSFCPPGKAAMAVGRIKRAVQSGWELPLESGLALEREMQQQLFSSDDAREGIAAFSERRPPNFKGR